MRPNPGYPAAYLNLYKVILDQLFTNFEYVSLQEEGEG